MQVKIVLVSWTDKTTFPSHIHERCMRLSTCRAAQYMLPQMLSLRYLEVSESLSSSLLSFSACWAAHPHLFSRSNHTRSFFKMCFAALSLHSLTAVCAFGVTALPEETKTASWAMWRLRGRGRHAGRRCNGGSDRLDYLAAYQHGHHRRRLHQDQRLDDYIDHHFDVHGHNRDCGTWQRCSSVICRRSALAVVRLHQGSGLDIKC